MSFKHLKQLILIFCVVLAVSLVSHHFYAADYNITKDDANETYYITHNNVQLRTGPGTNYKSKGYLKIYTYFNKIKKKSENRQRIGRYNEYWYEVESFSMTGSIFSGWVYGAFIKDSNYNEIQALKKKYIEKLPSVRHNAYYKLLMKSWWFDLPPNPDGSRPGTDAGLAFDFHDKVFDDVSSAKGEYTLKIGSLQKKSGYYILTGYVVLADRPLNTPYTKKVYIIKGDLWSGKYIFINNQKYYRHKKKKK